MHVSYCPGVHKVVIKSHPKYQDTIDKKWLLKDNKFIEIFEGAHINNCDGNRSYDNRKLQGDGATIKKITELANSYLSQLKNKL